METVPLGDVANYVTKAMYHLEKAFQDEALQINFNDAIPICQLIAARVAEDAKISNRTGVLMLLKVIVDKATTLL